MPFEVTLLQDIPALAARCGDVIVIRADEPEAPAVLCRKLDPDDTMRLLTTGPSKVHFLTLAVTSAGSTPLSPPSPLAPPARSKRRRRGLRLLG